MDIGGIAAAPTDPGSLADMHTTIAAQPDRRIQAGLIDLTRLCTITINRSNGAGADFEQRRYLISVSIMR